MRDKPSHGSRARCIDRFNEKSTLFSAYIILIGSSVVFAMLLVGAVAGVGPFRDSPKGKEDPDLSDSKKEEGKLTKIAAMAVAIYCTWVGRTVARVVSLGESRWYSAARIEALRTGLDERR